MFSWHTLGPLVPIGHCLYATADLSIVSDHVHPFMATMYPSSDGYFQHDTAPCHKARIISNWFLEHDNEFTELKWPPLSLGCGGTGALCPGCASRKSPSTARCYPINMGQHF